MQNCYNESPLYNENILIKMGKLWRSYKLLNFVSGNIIACILIIDISGMHIDLENIFQTMDQLKFIAFKIIFICQINKERYNQ
jgi:hypothetical protein